jgi:hypothetical protein
VTAAARPAGCRIRLKFGVEFACRWVDGRSIIIDHAIEYPSGEFPSGEYPSGEYHSGEYT